MNEGWASFWHKRILDSLDLPQELHLEFLVRHNQVVRPIPGGLNPYHLGLRIWEDIERRGNDPTPEERETPAARQDRRATCSSRPARSIATSRSSAAGSREPLMRELDLFRVRAARATTWSSATSPTRRAGAR